MKKISHIILFYLLGFSIFLTPGLNAQWLDAYIPDFKVNDDNLNSYQTNSQIGVDSAGNFVIVWRDVRNNPGNSNWPQVYCQRYSFDGSALGNNFRIGQDTASFPVVTMLDNGRFVVSWLRHFFLNSLQRYEIYYQRFTPEGIGVSMPLRVVDTSFSNGNELFSGLDISSDSIGNFVICWSKRPSFSLTPNIYFQRFDSSGNRIGTIDSVKEAFSNAEFPSITCNKNGTFIIVWQDNRFEPVGPPKYDIFMQRYTSAGSKIGGNVKVNTDSDPSKTQLFPSVSTNGYGYTVITWNDERICSLGEVYYQLYDETGSSIGGNMKANTSVCATGTGRQNVSMRGDKFFYIGWSDWNYAGREQSYGRRFSPSGNSIGSAYMVPAISPPGTVQSMDKIVLKGDRVYCTWNDTRNGGPLNYDIYCNVRGFQNPDTTIGIISSQLSEDYRLLFCYPNPFNASTRVKYVIQKNNTDVNLSVFDITGRQVTTLINLRQSKGIYKTSFDAFNLPSGIYFVKLEINSVNTNTKKLILIK